MEYWCHLAYIDLDFGVYIVQGVYDVYIIGIEFIAVIGPVARVGVIESQMNDMMNLL